MRKLATTAGVPFFVRWSPDAKRLRFSLPRDEHSRAMSLWELSIDDGHVRPLLSGWNPSWDTCCGNWTRDGKYFVFQSNGNIWALPEETRRTARQPVQLTSGPLVAYWPLPSPDGKRLFIAGTQERTELLRYHIKTDQFVPDFASISGTELDYSRDGKWIAYISVPGRLLMRSAVDGSDRIQLTSSGFHAELPRWSADGSQIAFAGGPIGLPSRIYVVPANGGAVRQITNGDWGAHDPTWSPDGKKLAFGSNGLDPKSVLHVVDVATGRESLLPSSEGMWSPRWSRDGRYIAGLFAPGWSVKLYDVAAQKQTELYNSGSGNPNWSPDGRYVFFGSDSSFFRLGIKDRKVERLATAKGLRLSGWFTVAADDSLIMARDNSTQEIYALDLELP